MARSLDGLGNTSLHLGSDARFAARQNAAAAVEEAGE
jgi:hypothetical protein